MTDVDVLIAGAGPTGLTLACDLTRRGITCRVLDRSDGPAQGSRAFTLKPRSLEVFDDLGLADRVLAVSTVETRMRFHSGTEVLFDRANRPARPDPSRPYPNAVALPQWRTEAALRDRLAELGGKVEFGSRVADHAADPDGVTVTVERDGQTSTVRARYLIGADGGRSRVRQVLGVPFVGSTPDSRALLADVRVSGLNPDNGVHMWMVGDGHMLVARPIQRDGTWQVVTSLKPDADGNLPEPTLETVRHAVVTRTGRHDIEVSDPTWLSVWRYNLRMVETYRIGRVLLAGDAAHVHSPFGGHGMNTGIQDAYNLGWKLALVLQGVAEETLLDTYEAERLPVARSILADSARRFSRVVPRRVPRPLLSLIMKVFLNRQQRDTRDDHPTYPTSPVTTDLAGRGKLRAGDVAPDGVVEIGGKQARLFDVLRGGHFTVLSFGVKPSSATGDHLRTYTVDSSAGDLVDRGGRLRRAYGARKGTVVVIRPDGYVGLKADPPCEHAVADYFRGVTG